MPVWRLWGYCSHPHGPADCKQMQHTSSMRAAILWTHSVMVDNVAMKTGCVARHEADGKLLPHGATWSFLNLYLFHGKTNLLSDKRIAITTGHYTSNCDSTTGLLRARLWQSRVTQSPPATYRFQAYTYLTKSCVRIIRVTLRCLRCFVVNTTGDLSKNCFGTYWIFLLETTGVLVIHLHHKSDINVS
jgi:hypothetical protein